MQSGSPLFFVLVSSSSPEAILERREIRLALMRSFKMSRFFAAGFLKMISLHLQLSCEAVGMMNDTSALTSMSG